MSRPGTGSGTREWDADKFAAKLVEAKASSDQQAYKDLLAQVAEHNYRITRGFPIPRTIYCSHSDCKSYRTKPMGKTPTVSVSTMTTAEAMLQFASDKRRTVCCLNFANGKDVGGGYKNGATAQEEDLCRQIPTLYSSLIAAQKDCYPYGPSTCRSPEAPERYSDVLYTTGLILMREGLEEGYAILPRHKQVQVSMVSAAAPNIKFAKDVNDEKLIYNTIEAIFIAPHMMDSDTDTLILGAWGCGAFGGDPTQIAEMFVRALVADNYGQLYKEIHFALPQLTKTDQNADIFRQVFNQYNVQVVEM